MSMRADLIASLREQLHCAEKRLQAAEEDKEDLHFAAKSRQKVLHPKDHVEPCCSHIPCVPAPEPCNSVMFNPRGRISVYDYDSD